MVLTGRGGTLPDSLGPFDRWKEPADNLKSLSVKVASGAWTHGELEEAGVENLRWFHGQASMVPLSLGLAASFRILDFGYQDALLNAVGLTAERFGMPDSSLKDLNTVRVPLIAVW